MSGIDTVLHPTFEALSAHADTLDDVASATRVGRHVARCERCRAEVVDIRALGDAARAMAVAGAPADLWSRIERAGSTPRSTQDHPGARAVPADLPIRTAGSHRALVAAAVMVVGAAAVAALWPRPASLQAAGTSRLTFTPSRPVPGGAVTVRYVPPAKSADAPRFVLVGRFARPAGQNPTRFGFDGWTFAQLADSLAELARTGDGAFVATLRMPADFLAVSVVVQEPGADRLDLDGAVPWMIIGASPRGEPSLASLLAAEETRMRQYDIAARYQPRQAVDVADSLKRYFPRHPAGWAFTHSYGVSRGRFDLLRFFEGAERKYASMSDALWPQPALDAERLHDMSVFARNIDEAGEAVRWAGRLADEHPEDPRAVSDLAGALHELELVSAPAVSDSVRRWLPSLERAYRRGPVPNFGYENARHLAERYGDSSAAARWTSRAAENGVVGSIWLTIMRVGRDSAGPALTELRRRADTGCVLPPARLPLLATVEEWRARCELDRGLAFGYLSSLTLKMGRAREALLEADSAIAVMRRTEVCAWPAGHLTHARAALALGDTATATTDLIAGAGRYLGAPTAQLDSMWARLGTRFDRAAATAPIDSARRDVRACVDRVRARREARARQGR